MTQKEIVKETKQTIKKGPQIQNKNGRKHGRKKKKGKWETWTYIKMSREISLLFHISWHGFSCVCSFPTPFNFNFETIYRTHEIVAKVLRNSTWDEMWTCWMSEWGGNLIFSFFSSLYGGDVRKKKKHDKQKNGERRKKKKFVRFPPISQLTI